MRGSWLGPEMKDYSRRWLRHDRVRIVFYGIDHLRLAFKSADIFVLARTWTVIEGAHVDQVVT